MRRILLQGSEARPEFRVGIPDGIERFWRSVLALLYGETTTLRALLIAGMIHDNRAKVVSGRIKNDHVHELLNELAEARSRLDRALIDSAEQRRCITAACASLGKTMQAVRRSQSALANMPRPHLNGHAPGDASSRKNHLKLLTPREIEVLRLIAEGLSTKEIAANLRISFKTVVSHRSHLLEKLGIHESATLVRLAVRAGIVSV